MSRSPVVARWELSRRLETKRRQQGVSVEELAKAMDFTRNYWSAVSNDRTLVAEKTLHEVMDFLEFEKAEQAELLTLRETARKRAWWDEARVLTDTAKRLYGLEDGATRLRIYESLLIPGLLQTDDYARAVIESDPIHSPVEVDEMLRTREERQRRLSDSPVLELSVILSEAALVQQRGGPDVQAAQLRHLLELMERRVGSLDIRVLPFAKNPGVIASSSTLLLIDFDSPHLPTVAWQEVVRDLEFLNEDDRQFRRLELAWNEGQLRALDSGESAELMRSVVDALGD